MVGSVDVLLGEQGRNGGHSGKLASQETGRSSEALGAGIWGGSGFQVETPDHQGAVKLAPESRRGGAPVAGPAFWPAPRPQLERPPP